MLSNIPIVIDCSKMKKENTGLYSFCLHLTNEIQNIARSEGKSITIFAFQKTFPIFPSDMNKIKIQPWNAFFFPLPSRYKIWHSTFQLGKYLPDGKQKKILTVHDLNFLYERNKKGYTSGIKLLQKQIDKADQIVAISEYTKQDLLKHMNLHEKEIEVIYNGCERYNSPVNLPAYVPQKKYIFALGTLLAKKNFHVLPCLLVGNDYELIISGNLSPYANVILEEAKKWDVETRVHITGPVKEEEKHWYLSHCSAFAFPSIAEGFGLPAVEAMYYGKPLFLSSKTSLPEIGGSLATYFNDEFDPAGMQKEFSDGMCRYEATNLESKLKERALQFSWETAAEKYWKIYKSLLEK